MSTSVRVKICCISSLEEAREAVAAGAFALGLVSGMPSGPGVIGEDLIAEIAQGAPSGIPRFLLTCLQDVQALAGQQTRCGADVLQICDRLSPAQRGELRTLLPGVKLVQVVHVTGPESLPEAREAAENSDGLLLDSGRPDLAVKELGGTGRTHDWSVSRAIRDAVAPLPVWLAGGLHPGNVADAIREVHPFGVDVCSGVRTHGRLDPEKLRAFMAAAGAAITN